MQIEAISTIALQNLEVETPCKHFQVWKGRDFWHQDKRVQIRLEDSGKVFLSTQEGHVSTLLTTEISVDELYDAIRGICVKRVNAKTAHIS